MNIALIDVLNNVHGSEKIRVLDYDHFICSDLQNNDYTVIFDGIYNDGRKLLDYGRYADALLHGLTVKDNILVFEISTRNDDMLRQID